MNCQKYQALERIATHISETFQSVAQSVIGMACWVGLRLCYLVFIGTRNAARRKKEPQHRQSAEEATYSGFLTETELAPLSGNPARNVETSETFAPLPPQRSR